MPLGFLLIGVFLIEFVVLFFSSHFLTNALIDFFYKLTKNRKASIYIFSFIFLPGTIIHELSHFFTAIFLFTPVGEIDVLPRIEDDGVRLGSVKVGKTGILRNTIIGLAPVFVGLTIIIALLWFFKEGLMMENAPFWQKLILFYAVFEIGNTLFSSKKDLEGATVLFGVLLMLILILFITLTLTNRLPSFEFLMVLNNEKSVEFLKKVDIFMLIPIGINALILLFTRLFHI